MKMIYVCSPLRGDLEGNMEKARGYCKKIITRCPNYFPFAPHIYLTQLLNDLIPEERETGLTMGLGFLKEHAHEVWVFGVPDMEHLSEGMKGEVAAAKQLGIPVYFGKERLEGFL